MGMMGWTQNSPKKCKTTLETRPDSGCLCRMCRGGSGRLPDRRGVPSRKALYVVAAEDPWDESPKVRTISFEGAGKVTAFAANGPVPLRRTADGRHYAFDLKSNGAVLVVFEM